MDISLVIIFLGLLIVGAHVFNYFFDKIKIPNALLLTIVGIIIGPVLGFVHTEHFGKVGPVFTTITLIIIIFNSGIGLRIQDLGSALAPSLIFSISNFTITAAVITVVAYIGGAENWITAAFIGAILGGTSSAVVIPIINQVKVNKKAETILMLESTLTDVLCLVVGLALFTAIRENAFSYQTIGEILWKSFLFSALLGIVTGVVWSLFLERIRRLNNSTILNLAMVFLVAGVTDKFGWNGGISALTFGIALGNAHLFQMTFMAKVVQSKELIKFEKSFLDEIAFIMQTYFFVYLGVSIKFGNPLLYLLGFIALAIILAVRPLAVRVSVWSKMPFKDLAIMSVMMPKGLVPAILASMPFQLGLAGGVFIRDFAFSVVLISLVVCSILVILIYRNLYFFPLLSRLFKGITEQHQQEAEPLENNEKAMSATLEKETSPVSAIDPNSI